MVKLGMTKTSRLLRLRRKLKPISSHAQRLLPDYKEAREQCHSLREKSCSLASVQVTHSHDDETSFKIREAMCSISRVLEKSNMKRRSLR